MGTDMSAVSKRWAEQLIDLSGRNNLLYYRTLKVGTLGLDGCSPGHFEALLRGRTIRSTDLLPANPADTSKRLLNIVKKADANYEEKGLRTSYIALGLATWKDEQSSSTPSSPILLAPIAITTRGAAAKEFELTVDGDWVLNPTLLFKLGREFAVSAELPENLDPDGDGFDPADAAAAFDKIQEDLAEVPRFAINETALIGNFSYSRQPMVDDLEGSVEELAAHPLIAALAGDPDAQRDLLDRHSDIGIDAPDHIEPRHEFLVLDADASQHHVINAVVSGADLVVQGPPGTGKSQTIANLISTLVSYRKSVLFVAQKRAAIDAVTKRLDDVGLGGLVMDLHDGVGSRKRTAAILGDALESAGQVAAIDRAPADAALVEHRNRLNTHSTAVNAVRPPWDISVFELQARLLNSDPAVGAGIQLPRPALEQLSVTAVDQLAGVLSEWINIGGPILSDPTLNPWAPAYGKVRSGQEAAQLLSSADALVLQQLPDASERMRYLLAEVGLREPRSIEQWAELFQLLDDAARVLNRLTPACFSTDLDGLIAALAPSGSAVAGAVAAIFKSSYKTALKSAQQLTVDGTSDASELRDLLIGANAVLDRWTQWSFDGRRPRLGAWQADAHARYDQIRVQFAALGAWIGARSLESLPLDQAAARVTQLSEGKDLLYRMPRALELEEILGRAGLQHVIATVRSQRLGPDDACELLRTVWARCVLETIRLTDPAIATFEPTERNRRREEFARLDREQVGTGRQRVSRAWAEWVHGVRQEHPDQESVILQESKKKARHRSLRVLFTEAPDLLQALTPCWAMSPLVVSQLLPSVGEIFDVVVFDEASQVMPPEAIPALLRGKRAVVAGDSKQLPPTSFFDLTVSADDLDEDDVYAMTDDMESILDSMSALLPSPKGTRTLTWHYRSQDERLIAFSNVQDSLYRGAMVTFPGVVPDAIQHELVDATAVPGSEESVGAEVTRVVDLMAEHARNRPDESLGVIALGMKHADRIDLAVRARRAQDAVLDTFMAKDGIEACFVKNLERVHGDERDNIILTLGYGKGANGQVRHAFGPINLQGGERRLNVAITRARRRMTVVSSFGSVDLDPAKLRAEGAQMLRRYLEYAESAGANIGARFNSSVQLNPFELDMLDHLQRAGLPVTPQYGVSGYRIDFVIAHTRRPGEMVLAVEADGASYHSSATARDRDRLRQEHLERLNWRFCRVWSTSWFRNRDAEVARVVAAWQEAVQESDRLAEAQEGRITPGTSGPTAESLLADPDPERSDTTPRRSGRPMVLPGKSISEYSHSDLLSVIKWIESDTLLRSDEQLLTEVMAELGFRRLGSKIVSAIQAAVTAAHSTTRY